MKLLKETPAMIWLALVAVALIASDCTLGTPDPEPIPQTRILEIRLSPDTVAVGDTVLIHAVIEDSLDPRFEYFWNLDDERIVPVNGTINGPKIRWWARGFEFLEPGEIRIVGAGDVRIDNGSEDSVSVTELIDIPVKK